MFFCGCEQNLKVGRVCLNSQNVNILLKCNCDENSSSRKLSFLLATTLLLHQKCLCKIKGPQSYEHLKCPKSLSAIKICHLDFMLSREASDVIVSTHRISRTKMTVSSRSSGVSEYLSETDSPATHLFYITANSSKPDNEFSPFDDIIAGATCLT